MADFETKVQQATQGEKPDILGVVALAVDRDGKTILCHAAGQTNLDSSVGKDIDKDSVFVLASATKIVTAVATLRLVQEGKLDLDDEQVVQQHLPELCQQEVITSAPGQPLTFEPRKNPITIRQLLTHTSGSGADILDPRLMAWRKERGEAPMHLSAPLPDAITMPSLFQPGEGWAYGGGSDWLGLLISRLTGSTFGAFLRQEVFDLVGCDAYIGFSRSEIEKAGGVIVAVATRGPDGMLKEYVVPEQQSERGGGGLFSSAENMKKILADLIATEPKILERGMLDVLFRKQLGEESKALAALRAQSHIFNGMAGALTGSLPATAINHALGGLSVTEDSHNLGKSANTMTWGGAFGSLWFVNREEGVAGFYGGSVFPPGPGKNVELIGDFVKSVREEWR